jgi:hypothetical protein
MLGVGLSQYQPTNKPMLFVFRTAFPAEPQTFDQPDDADQASIG